MANYKATIYGGWDYDTDAAPAHMSLVYKAYIYDTMPGHPLRRKAAGSMGWNFPACEERALDRNMIGRWQGLLTRSQVQIIETAVWNADNEYMPPERR
jgi:hypothetical protein